MSQGNGQTDKKQHLHEIIASFDTAMLVTCPAKSAPRGRPMAIAHLDDDDTLYFATTLDSTKVDELMSNPDVAVVMQGKMKYASLSGRASIDRDGAKIERFWKDSWKVFFPKGKDDPELALIRVKPEEGEYWDNSGVEGIRYLMKAAKALLTGEPPKHDEDLSGYVPLGS